VNAWLIIGAVLVAAPMIVRHWLTPNPRCRHCHVELRQLRCQLKRHSGWVRYKCGSCGRNYHLALVEEGVEIGGTEDGINTSDE
jgi:transposase-like protein